MMVVIVLMVRNHPDVVAAQELNVTPADGGLGGLLDTLGLDLQLVPDISATRHASRVEVQVGRE